MQMQRQRQRNEDNVTETMAKDSPPPIPYTGIRAEEIPCSAMCGNSSTSHGSQLGANLWSSNPYHKLALQHGSVWRLAACELTNELIHRLHGSHGKSSAVSSLSTC